MSRPNPRNITVSAIALTVAWTFLLMPKPAVAGQFTVAMCGDQAVASHAFKFDRNSSRFSSAASCGGSNSPGLKLEVEEGKAAASKWARWRSASPSPLLPIVGWSLRAHINDGDGYTGRICFERVGTEVRCFGDDSNGAYRLHGAVAFDGEALSLRLGCFIAKGCDGGKGAHLYARNISLTVADRVEPDLSLVGPLLSPGLKAGESFIRVEAADAESGLHGLEVRVNGDTVESRTLPGCLEPRAGVFSAYSPCPKSADEIVPLDTESPPFTNGSNLVEVCVSDVASTGLSPANRRCESVSVEVDNRCPSSAIATGSFSAGIGPGLDQSPVLSYGDSPELSGRVVSTSGGPLSGAVVCVQEKGLAESGGFRQVAELRSGTDGRFSIKLAAGASREVRLIQRSGSLIWVRDLTVKVHTRPSIALSRARLKGGGCLEIQGSVPGPKNAGVVVGLQGRVRGSNRWMTFGDAVTGPTGGFTYRYCFHATSSTTVYELRSVVKEQGIYPYLGGTSAVKRVKVSID